MTTVNDRRIGPGKVGLLGFLVGGNRQLVGGGGPNGLAAVHDPRDTDVGIALINHTYQTRFSR